MYGSDRTCKTVVQSAKNRDQMGSEIPGHRNANNPSQLGAKNPTELYV